MVSLGMIFEAELGNALILREYLCVCVCVCVCVCGCVCV
jgi:hypothetical protein